MGTCATSTYLVRRLFVFSFRKIQPAATEKTGFRFFGQAVFRHLGFVQHHHAVGRPRLHAVQGQAARQQVGEFDEPTVYRYDIVCR